MSRVPLLPEEAISEIVGALALIAIFSIVAIILASGILGAIHTGDIPAVNFAVTTRWDESCYGRDLIILHNGGDPLERSNIRIFVNNQARTSEFIKEGTGSTAWTTWNAGERLILPCIGDSNTSVTITYNGPGGQAVLFGEGFDLSQQLVADFVANQTFGRLPFPVQFSDRSTGGPVAWSWSFGDGGSSTQPNPLHTYASAGTYTVSLTVTKSDGFTNTLSKAGYIGVIDEPIAAFTYSPLDPNVNETINFTDMSSGNPTSWNWTFGDGTTSVEQNPQYSYPATGSYIVTLVANNAFGGSAPSSQKITIGSPSASVPVAYFTTLNNTTTGCQIETIQFFDNSTGIRTEWLWNFGDGGTSTLQNPVHTYNTPGVFTVRLTVSNSDGSNTLIREGYISISSVAPVAHFTSDESSECVPFTMQFWDNSTGTPTEWLWDFGDGTTSDLKNPVHTYHTIGRYDVSLSVNNSCGNSVDNRPGYVVTKELRTITDFTATPQSGCVPVSVQFNDTTSGGTPVNWLWTFGDGNTSVEQNPLHIYTSTGIYNVTLTTNSEECGGNISSKLITVSQQPTASFSSTQVSGCLPANVQFNDTSTGVPTSWTWNFGDGGTSTLQNTSHTYATAGTKTVTLTVNSICGNSMATKDILVSGSPLVTAHFTANPTSVCPNQQIQFTDTSTGSPTLWLWDFGDGTTSSLQNPVKSYSSTGSYTVSLNASSTCGGNTLTKMNYIAVNQLPAADFSYLQSSGCPSRTVQFTDTTIPVPTSWLWNFGDGNTSTAQNPSHTYADSTSRTVTLTVANACGSSQTQKTVIPVVVAPVANFIATPTSGSQTLTVQFTDQSTGCPTSWAWDFENDGVVDNTQQNPTHSYSARTYSVKLTATNSNGSSSITIPNYIRVSLAPTAANLIQYNKSGGGGYLVGGTYVEFVISTGNSQITVNNNTYYLGNNDKIRLVIKNNQYSGYANFNTYSISNFHFNVDYYQWDNKGRLIRSTSGLVDSISVNYDSYTSNLRFHMPSQMATTTLNINGNPIIPFSPPDASIVDIENIASPSSGDGIIDLGEIVTYIRCKGKYAINYYES